MDESELKPELSSPPGRRRDQAPAQTRTETRRRRIADLVVSTGSATPHDLATEFDVSLVTIHRDLDELERRGVVRKFHGGVTAQPSGIFESQMSYRLASRVAEKQAIADAALDYIKPGMSILLDDSTTVLQMIEPMAERAPLYVATTFLPALQQLARLSREHDLTVIGLGGRYDEAHDSFLGVSTREQVEGLHVDAVFMSTSAVSRTDMFHQEEHVASLKRAMLNSATETYLLVDHSKLDRVALLKIAELTELTLIITDSAADPDLLDSWQQAGISYQIAEPGDECAPPPQA